jgi:hypothetical protein
MAATPETLRPEVPTVQEHIEEFPETIQQIQGAKVVQKTFKAQVKDDKGKPIIQTQPTQIITTVQPPADTQTLTQQSKGDTTSSTTWLAAFWLRIIKKALHFGWQILGGEKNVS